ncbi:MAG: adenylate/guanylate cyclase domain-containing protein [Chloroflexi bacterium]|nr:adenylate/guanylate cyclase domain-containing protein [Chloroflexota bacterium]
MEHMPPGGAEVDVAVLFADVRGSTGLGERLGPGAFASLLNRFYEAATNVLIAHDAIIDKMVGDEVMALFVPGYCGPGYRRLAAQAGEAVVRAVGYGQAGEPWLPVGVAVHAGPAFVGNVGGAGIVDFTALGDTINTAARLQGQAAAGEVVLSEEVYQAVAERYGDLEKRVLTLRGREAPLAVRMLRPRA